MKKSITNIITFIKSVKKLYIVLFFSSIVLIVAIVITGISLVRKQTTDKEQLEKDTEAKITVTRLIDINGKKVTAEVASSPEERIKGLMGRTVLEDGKGMLFTFGQENIYTFWMKNMKIGLDFLWIGKNLTITDMDLNVPPCTNDNCEYYTPAQPVQYVLEVPAGWADKNGVKIGDKVTFTDMINNIPVTTAPSQ